MKRKVITISIAAFLVITIAVSFVLMRVKSDTSHINNAQKIATLTKPAVVRILSYAIVQWKFSNYYDSDVANFFNTIQNKTLIGGSGSGGTLSSNGYIVTNAHVVEINKLEDQKIVDAAFTQLVNQIANAFKTTPSQARSYLLKYTTVQVISKYLKVMLPSGEILDGEIKSYGAPVGEGKDVAVIKVEGKNLPTIRLGDSDKVQLQDNIWVFGYPGAADSDVLSENSAAVVSITDGKVSAVDKKSAQGAPVLQISAASTHGNSGGPVTNDKGEIVGLLTFRGNTVNGQEVQGFNFAVPVNTVKEFVGQAGAKNEPSDVDIMYKEALELYWGGYYKDALVKFEEVQRLYPAHSEVKKYITDSQQNVGKSKILWSKYKTIFIAYDIVSGVLIIVVLILGFVVKSKKFKNINEGINTEEKP
jgi:S1-C subfamily serine protease